MLRGTLTKEVSIKVDDSGMLEEKDGPRIFRIAEDRQV